MNEEQRSLCMDLVIRLDGKRRITKAEFLKRFPSAVSNEMLSLELLEDAERTENAEDLSCALIAGFSFGFSLEHVDILCRFLDTDWHSSHEDIVSALDELRTLEAVDHLFRATQWIPKSLEFDDNRALAVKAIWALGNLPGAESIRKLKILALSNNDIVRDNAVKQLERRQHTG